MTPELDAAIAKALAMGFHAHLDVDEDGTATWYVPTTGGRVLTFVQPQAEAEAEAEETTHAAGPQGPDGRECPVGGIDMPGKRFAALVKAAGGKAGGKRYEGLRKPGLSKSSAAAIAISGKSKAGRKRMARKAARTRKKQGS